MSIHPPHGIDEVRRVYGDISVVDGRVLPRMWEVNNCVTARNLPLWGPKPLYVHRLVLEPLSRALAACEAHGGYAPKTMGCFNPRNKRSRPEPSLHSWAVAVDVDADDNPPISDCPPGDPRRTKYTFPDWWVDIWRGEGWTWGGDFKGNYFDPQHFQYASGF